ncbi:MAG TPA: hypothetical protein VGF98_10710 [Candidatus Tumulicola sp.]
MCRAFAFAIRSPGVPQPNLGNRRYHRAMLPQHSVPEPTEVVIWTAGSLLGALLGLGGAFGLWLFLRHSDAQTAAHAAVVTVGAGIAVVGLSAERPPTRLFWIFLAGMLVVSYLFGGAEFARLVP